MLQLPKPAISLYTVALESCMCGSDPVDSDRAFEIYRQAERSKQPLDVHFFSTMIRVAGRAGMPDLALSIEDNMRVQGTYSSPFLVDHSVCFRHWAVNCDVLCFDLSRIGFR